jgi:translation initiation factor 2 subunit 1
MYKKKGFPEVGEFIVCTVSRPLPHSAFVTLDEYDNLEGLIHASEIPRRWIRNMKTYMKVGRQLVCKVMDVDTKTKQINLSVRRVGASQERTRLASWKNEKKANDMLEMFAKTHKIKLEKVYSEVVDKILTEYGAVYPVFIEVARSGGKIFAELKIDKKVASDLEKMIANRIVLPKAEIRGLITMSSKDSDGLNVIKDAISEAKRVSKEYGSELDLKYVGAPKYQFKLNADDFKQAETAFEKISESLEKYMGKHEGSFGIKKV